jgi:hypothetical protein
MRQSGTASVALYTDVPYGVHKLQYCLAAVRSRTNARRSRDSAAIGSTLLLLAIGTVGLIGWGCWPSKKIA